MIGCLELPDPEQRRSYGRALRAYGRPMRLPGLALSLAGAAMLLIRGGGVDAWSAGLVADGWVKWISVNAARARCHKQPMAEPTGSGEGGSGEGGSGEGWAF